MKILNLAFLFLFTLIGCISFGQQSSINSCGTSISCKIIEYNSEEISVLEVVFPLKCSVG